jgi:uncharacterized protein (DUF488 family)
MNNWPYEIMSIGYGNRHIDDFMEILICFEIEFLIDVRSYPYSKFNPFYNGDLLKAYLWKKRIRYVFMGDTLGGKPNDNRAYNEEGYVDYTKYEALESYNDSIDRLVNATKSGIKIAIMCSESKPEECHRSKLIGQTLHKRGVSIQHIDENILVIPHWEIIGRITKNDRNLFEINLTSRKKYKYNAKERAI